MVYIIILSDLNIFIYLLPEFFPMKLITNLSSNPLKKPQLLPLTKDWFKTPLLFSKFLYLMLFNKPKVHFPQYAVNTIFLHLSEPNYNYVAWSCLHVFTYIIYFLILNVLFSLFYTLNSHQIKCSLFKLNCSFK